jgi:hypothetical protein
VVNSSQCKQLSLCFLFSAKSSPRTLHCSKLRSTQTARLSLSLSSNSSCFCVLIPSHRKQHGRHIFQFKKVNCNTVKNSTQRNSSAGAYFQCKQLGWYTVVGLLYLRANSWDGCILSVLTALLVHCSKFISAQTAALALSFGTTSQLAHCSNFISMQTAQFKKLRWYTAGSFCQGKQLRWLFLLKQLGRYT